MHKHKTKRGLTTSPLKSKQRKKVSLELLLLLQEMQQFSAPAAPHGAARSSPGAGARLRAAVLGAERRLRDGPATCPPLSAANRAGSSRSSRRCPEKRR